MFTLLTTQLTVFAALACSPSPVEIENPAGADVMTNLVAPMIFKADRLASAVDRGGHDFTNHLTVSAAEPGKVKIEHRPGDLDAKQYFEHFPVQLVFERGGKTLAPAQVSISRKAVTSGGTCKFTPRVRQR